MTLQSVFRTGIAGLKSQATRMSTISHNIANARTDGYKAGTASFASLVNAGGGQLPPIGQRNSAGVTAHSSTNIQSQGHLRQTGSNLDLAINGKGFFLVRNSSSDSARNSSGNGSETSSSNDSGSNRSSSLRSENSLGCLRTGSFHVDKDGFLVNPQGLTLQGWECPETRSFSEVQPTLESVEDVRIPEGTEETPSEETPFTCPVLKKVTGSQSGEYKMKLNKTYHLGEITGGYTYWKLECSDGTSRTVEMHWGYDPLSGSESLFYCEFSLPGNDASGIVSAIVDRDTGVITDFAGGYDGSGPLPPGFHYDKATNELTYEIPDADGATIAIDFSEVRIKERETGMFEDLAGKTISFKKPVYCGQGHSTSVADAFGKGDAEKLVAILLSDSKKVVAIVDGKTKKTLQATLTTDEAGNVTGYTIANLTSGFSADGKTRGSSYSADEPIKLYTTPGNSTETFTLDLSGMRFIVTSEENPAEVEEEAAALGQVQSLAITEDGILTGSFKDGSTRSLYQLAMANCPAPDKMTEKSGGFYIPTPDSGNLHVGTSGSSGLGVITPRALEESTTDIATELANAIKTQYVYSANAKTIATASEMLETLLKV